ncbi:MAG: AAA family ATPase [Myxococcota bacterium]|jgi:MoxR-like ATPase|nr:AAA family ATPase [Myxococcota bacterium]
MSAEVYKDPHDLFDFEDIEPEVDNLRTRINNMRKDLHRYWVDKESLIDLMCVCTLSQEPLLLVGKPGTAKSDLVVKFVQALGLDTSTDEYFEYMLTQFTEPGEIVGPIDINKLKDGHYIRRIDGKLPRARIVFLDEIFKSNSAILNTLLTVINERKFYQDGKPTRVPMLMLFAATNEIPDNAELAALRDRFTLKAESRSVRSYAFDELLAKGMQNEVYKATKQRPWAERASLEDFLKLKVYLDHIFASELEGGTHHRSRYFPDDVYRLFVRILKALEKEFRYEVSDRKVIKLYKLIRTRAFLFHGGVVSKSDLLLLRYISDRAEDLDAMRDMVDRMLSVD